MTDMTSVENVKGKHRQRIVAGVLAVAVAIGAGAGGGVIGTQLLLARSHDTTATQISAVPVVNPAQQSLEQVVRAVSPSVVTITVAGRGQTSLGSGVVLSKDGLILTNNHVVADGARGAASSAQVQFADGTTAAAAIVGTDAEHDLAVLRASGVSGLTPATLGSTVTVGDTVLAFGSPLGLQGTVTAGIVSAVDRTLEEGSTSLTGLIQTDAAINSGNSGGPLVDTAGRVVGINVAIASTGQDTGNIGLGFAIPAQTVQSVVDRLAGAVQ